MIIAIDIGNTAIKIALLKGKRIVKEKSIYGLESQPSIRSGIRRTLRAHKKHSARIKEIIICSVVPKHLQLASAEVKKVFKRNPKVVERQIKVPIKNNYKNPKHVGADRLVGAFAAKVLYGYPAIIIDFGTAVTIDVINDKGAYDGGIIVPGIRLSAESLFKKTALLPNIDTFKPPRTLIGRDTKSSILSGLFYGYAALCRGLIEEIARNMKGKPKVILTGGHTGRMKKFLGKKVYKIDKELVIKGIYLTYKSYR